MTSLNDQVGPPISVMRRFARARLHDLTGADDLVPDTLEEAEPISGRTTGRRAPPRWRSGHRRSAGDDDQKPAHGGCGDKLPHGIKILHTR